MNRRTVLTGLLAGGLLALTGALETRAIASDEAADVPPPPPPPVIRLDEPVLGPDGVSHADCYITVGIEFSTVECADGFTETS